jgi:hypothetical protein
MSVPSTKRARGRTSVAPKEEGGLTMRTILYARVSTADQSLGHQRAQAEAAGFEIVQVCDLSATAAPRRY